MRSFYSLKSLLQFKSYYSYDTEIEMDNVTIKAVYDMKPNAYGRVIYILWYLTLIISGIFGNFIILTASVRFRAIRLDNVSEMLIRHIAVADVSHIILVLVPGVTSIISDRWVFGDTFCRIQSYLLPMFFSTSIYQLCGLNINKLMCLINPLECRSRSSRTGCFIGTLFWLNVVVSLFLVHLITFTLKTWDYRYSPAVFHCTGTYQDAGNFYEIMTSVAVLVPCFVILVTTVCLLCFVHKVKGLQRQSVQTLVLVSGVFCLSFIPFGVTTALVAVGDSEARSYGFNFAIYLRVSTALANLNAGVNATIYFLTIKSFNEFVRDLPQHMRHLFRDNTRMQNLQDCKS